MLPGILRPAKRPFNLQARERSPFPSLFTTSVSAANGSRYEHSHIGEAYDGAETSNDEDDDDDVNGGNSDENDDEGIDENEPGESTSDEDGEGESMPLLPIFSALHLDALPVYNLTHTIRLLVVARCDTTLSWDQLRSPQVSQFILKPIQQEIRTNHFCAATECALMANCLQFQKEASANPGIVGASMTRAMVCELLAIKLLKEYTTRELIDALSYDFDPLQEQTNTNSVEVGNVENVPKPNSNSARRTRSARISCLEIAIRALAKRFLAHPLVVQHLEAIWAGSIVFHSAADSMHRRPTLLTSNRIRGYGTTTDQQTSNEESYLSAEPPKPQSTKRSEHLQNAEPTIRRAVTLYNPKDASLFKLSRLRVPRYRNLLSTGSFAVLLGLFLAVLIQRSLEITNLEIVFWFWAAGYMLDEVIGFNEQGFSLYIASFWNTFDLGILIILFAHLCLRIYGIVLVDVGKHKMAGLAYDVLAADAILLFPRLFSVLDHYRYFSQLLIAFRMMATDLVAIFVLIIISCSGFFVALTLSFGNEGIDTPGSVAYALLQILMGFTPAAWDRWSGYNALGKTILTLFLFICHFLVVTILITVLTNSFMAIVRNANEEHQFVFAVNVISMIKSDALFAYVAPTNLVAWILTPVRYFIPFRQYIKINRTIIKVTHFPVLFLICAYERTILQASVVDSIDVIDPPGRGRSFKQKLPRLHREQSVATFRQDRALEEVFRRPFDSTTRHSQQSQERRKASNVVSTWMKTIGEELASPLEDRSTGEGLENRRGSRRGMSQRRLRQKSSNFPRFSTRSAVSDPEEFLARELFSPSPLPTSMHETTPSHPDGPAQQDVSDEEEVLARTTIEREGAADPPPRTVTSTSDNIDFTGPRSSGPGDYFSARNSPRQDRISESFRGSFPQQHSQREIRTSGDFTPSNATDTRPSHHLRNVSSATVVHRPIYEETASLRDNDLETSEPSIVSGQGSGHANLPKSGINTPGSKLSSNVTNRARNQKRGTHLAKPRPGMPTKATPGFNSAPNVTGLANVKPRGKLQPRPTLDMELVSDIGDNKPMGGGYIGAIPASFATKMAKAEQGFGRHQDRNEDYDMLSRIVMARMNSLEEGFREVIHEMRETIKRQRSRSRTRSRRSSSEQRTIQSPEEAKVIER